MIYCFANVRHAFLLSDTTTKHTHLMIKILAMILTVVGIAGLIVGVLGIFGRDLVALSPWAATILGAVFFFAGISMLQSRRDTDEIR